MSFFANRGLWVFIAALFACLPQKAKALETDSYGFIRVRVVAQNPSHDWKVSLRANGHSIGMLFSHKDYGFDWAPLSRGHLNANGSSTPIAATYGPLQANGCSFRYEVFFAFSRGEEEISLGVFDAPASGTAGSIPIGLSCGGDRGRVCSSNPRIQNRIAKMYNQRMASDFNEWKRQQDARLAAARERERSLNRAANDELAGKGRDRLPESRSNAEQDAQLERLREMVEKWEDSLNQQRQQVQAEEQAARANEEAARQILQQQVHLDSELARREQLYSALDRAAGTGIGQFAQAMVGLDILTLQLIRDQRAFFAEIRNARSRAAEEERFRIQAQIERLESFRRNIIYGDVFRKVANFGVRLSPAGDFLDACEAMSMRENCDPDGRELGRLEQGFAAIGAVVGTRHLWSRVWDSNVARRAAGRIVPPAALNSVRDLVNARRSIARGGVEVFSPIRPGPLHEKLARRGDPIPDSRNVPVGGQMVGDTFRGGSYISYVTRDEVVLYRAYSDQNLEMGRWASFSRPRGPTGSILELALNPIDLPQMAGNRATRWVEIRIPAGTRLYEGYVGPVSRSFPQGQNLVGGGLQVFLDFDVIPGAWIVNRGVF